MTKPLKYPRFSFLLINLTIAILLIIAGGYFVLRSLDRYTSHGESISVPAFQMLTQQEAEQVAHKNRLRIKIIDSLYDETLNPGVILEQYPMNGARVKSNRLIQLTVNAHHPEQVSFPQLNNAPYRQTLQTLQAKGFKIGTIQYAPSEFKNLVLNLQYNGENILPGSKLRKGATIDLVLGDGGGNNYIPTPQLQGLPLKQALSVLKENYLNTGKIIPDASIKNKNGYSSAIIYQQEPSRTFLSSIPAGSYVNLYITLDQKRIQALDSLIVTE